MCSMCLLLYVVLDVLYMLLDMLYVLVVVCGALDVLYMLLKCARYALCARYYMWC